MALDANTVIVSCGMTNFESTVYTDGKQQKFRTHLANRKVEVDHFRKPKRAYRDDVKIFSESFKANYPTLCLGRDVYIIDCNGFDSLEHDLLLRSHTGNHPTILKGIVESQKFAVINETLRELKPFRKQLVINVCTSGRHQSVGNASGQKAVVQDQLYGVNANQRPDATVQLLHLQADSHWERLCGTTGNTECSLCDTSIRQNRQNMQRAYGLLKHMIKPPFNVELTPTN